MSAEKIKQIWPEWTVEKDIGEGAFGKVYKAVRSDNNFNSYAAIKVISIPKEQSEVDTLRSDGIDINGTRTYFKRVVDDFVNEIQLMESLKGIQNIVSVEDYKVIEKTDEIGWEIYIRMELLTPFITYSRENKLSEADVIKLGVDICTALEICGKRNIIHRDIKPENIFVNDFGYFKLGDFGIARKLENVTGGLSQKGTINYMAPEVANSSHYDSTVDTYSLGIVLYKLLNENRLPFIDPDKLLNPNDRIAAAERRIHGEPLTPPCEASPAMADLILHACAFDPGRRFASAAEMKQALMSVANGTYKIVENDLDKTTTVRRALDDYDKTTAVRRAPDDYDRTTSVRKAPNVVNTKAASVPNTFGTPKKRARLQLLIVVALAAVILVCAGLFALPKLIGDGESGDTPGKISSENSDTSSKIADYSKLDEEHIAAIIEEADTLAKNENYEGAVKKIQAGLATYKDSDELSAKLDEYNSALTIQKNETLKADAITNSEKQANNSDFKGAIATLDAALKQLGDDDELVSLRSTYADKYAEAALSQVDLLMTDKDYDGAKKVLKEACSIVPENQSISNKAEEIEQYKTVSLNTLKVMGSEDFEWNNGSPADPFGTNYSSAVNYSMIDCHPNYSIPKTAWIEYKTDNNYDSLSITIAPNSNIRESGYGYVQVFVDDVLRYTSPQIKQKTEPFTAIIDISDSEYIKVSTTLIEGGCVLLSDVEASNTPGIETYMMHEVSLTELSEFNGGLNWNNEYPLDAFSKDYSSAYNYSVIHAYPNLSVSYDYSAEYYINKQYDRFKMEVSTASCFNDGCGSIIRVYVDDEIKYTSPQITKKTPPFSIDDIDLSGASYLKIEAVGNGCVIISNAALIPNS